MKVIAHRGRPENTVQGIRSAVRLGVDAIEFDVRLHPSGALLLMHDATMDRTTRGRGLFADATPQELRALSVPTLDEALDACGRTRAIIELKTSGKTADAVATVLNRRGKGAWTVSSFDHRQLLSFRAMCPSVDVSPIVYGVPLDCVQCALALRAKSIAVSSDFLDPRLLRHAQDHGIDVHVYTVNTERELRAVAAAGRVTGIFTDVAALGAFRAAGRSILRTQRSGRDAPESMVVEMCLFEAGRFARLRQLVHRPFVQVVHAAIKPFVRESLPQRLLNHVRLHGLVLYVLGPVSVQA